MRLKDGSEKGHIIKRLVYPLVRRHIAGSTTESVLATIRKLNEQGLHATATLLNDHVEQATKARYNTNAYVQFIKQISRLNLNSDVSLRLSQVGFGLDEELMRRNMQQILDSANEAELRLWIESEESIGNEELMPIYRELKASSDGLGVEITPMQGENGNAFALVKPKDMIKLRCHLHKEDIKANKKESFNAIRLYKSYIDKLISRRAHVTVLDHNAHMIPKIAAMEKGYRDSVTFEAPLGYGGSKLKKMAANRFNVSIYVPYGKDWVPYLINKLTEGRLRNIAIALLNGQSAGYEHGGF